MADILSQDEVDLLLATVSDDPGIGDAVEARDVAPRSVLTAYDFRRPERVSKEQLKGLQSLFEAFSREFSVLLPPFLRTVVRVDLSAIDQLTYDEFILSVSRPTSMTVVNMNPLDGKSVIEMSPGMVFPIVDRVLGGRGHALSAPRELTEIESRIVYRIVLMVLDSWKRAWEQLVQFELSIENQETDPLIVQIVPGSEMVILVGYEIYIGEQVGSMNLCIPLLVLNPVLDQISQQTRFQRHVSDEIALATRTLIAHAIRSANLKVEPILGRAKLTLREVASLQIGDVVTLNSREEDLIPVLIGGIPRLFSRPGRRGEQSSVQIVSLARDSG